MTLSLASMVDDRLKQFSDSNYICDVNVVHSVHSELQDDLGSEDGEPPANKRARFDDSSNDSDASESHKDK